MRWVWGHPHGKAVRSSVGSGRLLAAAALVLLALLIAPGAALAKAGKPIAGAIYRSILKGEEAEGGVLRFVVSANARTLTKVHVGIGFTVDECHSGGTPSGHFAFPTSIAVKSGGFRVTPLGVENGERGHVRPLGSGTSLTVSGTFTASGVLHGTWQIVRHCVDPFSGQHTVHNRTEHFESTARPEGANSEYCPDHAVGGELAEEIVAISITCPEVDAALAAGGIHPSAAWRTRVRDPRLDVQADGDRDGNRIVWRTPNGRMHDAAIPESLSLLAIGRVQAGGRDAESDPDAPMTATRR